jgi:hypothetical protein
MQDFHDSKGGFGADTGVAARRLLGERGWSLEDYQGCVQAMRKRRRVYEGEEGFFPPGRAAWK